MLYRYVGTTLFTALGPSNNLENLTEHMLLDRKQGLGHYVCSILLTYLFIIIFATLHFCSYHSLFGSKTLIDIFQLSKVT